MIDILYNENKYGQTLHKFEHLKALGLQCIENTYCFTLKGTRFIPSRTVSHELKLNTSNIKIMNLVEKNSFAKTFECSNITINIV